VIAGVSQGCITPPVGVELSGFRACRQPSTGVHDDLFVRGLYLEEDGNRLLWLHCDLIGFMRDRVQRLRERLRLELGLEAHQVLLTATHTHSGPATLFLRHCGAIRYRFPCDLASQETEILASRDTRSRGAKTPPSSGFVAQ